METLKYLYQNYKKEIILVSIVIVFVISGVLIFTFNFDKSKNTDSSILLLEDKEETLEIKNDEVKEEVKKVEEIINVQVDIKGEVKKPGVYVVSENSRVIDVINSAGGLTKNADTKVNNLSRKVKDEMVIIIYSKDEVKNFKVVKEEEKEVLENSKEFEDIIINDSALETDDILTNQDVYENKDEDNQNADENKNEDSQEVEKEEIDSSKISINIATKEQLLTLSGIGESKADAIIAYRKENGNFEKIEDIMNVSGIGESLFAKIKDFITV